MPLGLPCTNEGAFCEYPSLCGGVRTTTHCVSGRWITYGDLCIGGCPSAQPAEGGACETVIKCKFFNGCGGYNTGWCDGTHWTFETTPCKSTP